MIKLLTYTALIFSGFSKNYFKNIKNRYNLREKVEIHHIIPREFKNHPTIKYSNYNIENGYNLVFLPTYKGASLLNLHADRPIHANGHPNYNSYVRFTLDLMFINNKTQENNLCELNIFLRENMRHLNIPW